MVLMVWASLCMLERAAFTGDKFFQGKVYMMEKSIHCNLVNDHKEMTCKNTKELKKLATCNFKIDTECGKEGILFYFSFVILSQRNTTWPV
jgi:hypothetical protein